MALNSADQTSNLPSDSQRLLLKASLISGKEAVGFWNQWKMRENIDHLDGASYRLLPLLYRNLAKLNVQDRLLTKLRGIERYHWCQNQVLVVSMCSVLKELEIHKIEVMALKGIALILNYYDSWSLRPMSDFDLMIPTDSIEKTVDIFEGNGWRAMDELSLKDQNIRKHRHSQSFKNNKGEECDLHWTPLSATTAPGAEEDFWESSYVVKIRSHHVRVMNPTEQLFHVMVHGGYYNRFPPIRWIADSFAILEKRGEEIDWDRFFYLGKKYSTTTILKNSLTYLLDEFKLNLPPQVKSRVRCETPDWKENIEILAISHRIPEYRFDLFFMKSWVRHSQKMSGKSILARALSFPKFLRVYLMLDSWWDAPGYALHRVKTICRKR